MQAMRRFHASELAMRLALTHYDILTVTSDAPQEVIRAAYKALCRQYHPDLNAGSADTTRTMAIINVSYDILSSPSKRRAYDDWLAEQESLHGRIATILPSWRKLTYQFASTMPRDWYVLVSRHARIATSHIWQHAAVYTIAMLTMAITAVAILHPEGEPFPMEAERSQVAPSAAATELRHVPTSYPQLVLAKATTISVPDASASGYVRPRHAPNGQAWPTSAAYLADTPILHDDGNATVKVENADNASDVYARLIAVSGLNEYLVREFYIPAYGQFALGNLPPGRYDLRYFILDNGRESREEFVINDGAGSDSTWKTQVTVSLDNARSTGMESAGFSSLQF